MERKRQANQHRNNADAYLRQTEDSFAIDPKNGLYCPKLIESDDSINDRDEQIGEGPVLIFPERDEDWPSKAVAFATAAGVFVSALTLILLFFTVQYARNQWREARRQADAAIEAAHAGTKASDTARSQLEELQKQFRITQRPWLSVEAKVSAYDWDLRNPRSPSVKIVYAVTVKNFGSLPASDVYLLADDSQIKPMVGKDLVNSLIKQERTFCSDSIAKNDFINQTHTGAVTVFPQQTRDLTSQPQQRLWNDFALLRGCVVYRSPTFTKPRQTGFFYEVHSKANPLDIPKPGDPASKVILTDYSGIMPSD